jgi:hypothetical protein
MLNEVPENESPVPVLKVLSIDPSLLSRIKPFADIKLYASKSPTTKYLPESFKIVEVKHKPDTREKPFPELKVLSIVPSEFNLII